MQIISIQLYRALINHTMITSKNYRRPRESITKDGVGKSIIRNRLGESIGKPESKLRRKFSSGVGGVGRWWRGMSEVGLRSKRGKTHLEAGLS